MLQVLITVDTEVWPRLANARGPLLAPEVDRDIYGVTPGGEFGIRYQMDLLNAHGLRAVYFVESLFADAGAHDLLQGIVSSIQESGHDVQLHLHTEWLEKADLGLLSGRKGRHLLHFSLEEQRVLLSQGIRNLRNAGATNVRAFRAGNFGANTATLKALALCGIAFDSSYNVTFPEVSRHMELERVPMRPLELHGVTEVPISFFREPGGRLRHVQVNGCSAAEMESFLMQAWQKELQTFVIVFHSFELMNRRRTGADPVVTARFKRLCRFLERHPDKFQTATFQDIETPTTSDKKETALVSGRWKRSWRYCEQALRKAFR